MPVSFISVQCCRPALFQAQHIALRDALAKARPIAANIAKLPELLKGKLQSVGASAFVKEGFRMFMPPRCSPLAIFADEYSEPHAGTAVAILAGLTKFHQAVAQFVVVISRRRRWGNDDRLSRSRAVFWRNDEPRSVGPLPITSVLVISVAARPRLALCRDGSAGYTTNDCTSCRPSTAAYCAAKNGPRSAAQNSAAYWVLGGGVLYRHRKRNGHKG